MRDAAFQDCLGFVFALGQSWLIIPDSRLALSVNCTDGLLVVLRAADPCGCWITSMLPEVYIIEEPDQCIVVKQD